MGCCCISLSCIWQNAFLQCADCVQCCGCLLGVDQGLAVDVIRAAGVWTWCVYGLKPSYAFLCVCCLQLDKAAADATEFKAGCDKYAADAAEYKAGYDKLLVDNAEQEGQLSKAAADAAEYKAGFDKAAADAAEFKAGYDKFAADAAEYKAGNDKLMVDSTERQAQVGRTWCHIVSRCGCSGLRAKP